MRSFCSPILSLLRLPLTYFQATVLAMKIRIETPATIAENAAANLGLLKSKKSVDVLELSSRDNDVEFPIIYKDDETVVASLDVDTDKGTAVDVADKAAAPSEFVFVIATVPAVVESTKSSVRSSQLTSPLKALQLTFITNTFSVLL